MDFVRFLIHMHGVYCSAWFFDIRISGCKMSVPKIRGYHCTNVQ